MRLTVSIVESKGIILDNRDYGTVEYIPFADVRIIQMNPDDKEIIILKGHNRDHFLDARTFDRLSDNQNRTLWQRTVVSWTAPPQTYSAWDLYKVIIKYWLASITGKDVNP